MGLKSSHLVLPNPEEEKVYILALALIHLRKSVAKDERGIMKNTYRKQLIELVSSIMN